MKSSAGVQVAIFGRRLDGPPDAVVGHHLVEQVITDPRVLAASGLAVHTALLPSPDPGATVDGSLFWLDDEQLAAADAYEVDAYARRQVLLASGTEAWVYSLRSG